MGNPEPWKYFRRTVDMVSSCAHICIEVEVAMIRCVLVQVGNVRGGCGCCSLVFVYFEVSCSFKFVPKHYFNGFIHHYCFRAGPNLGIHMVILRTSESGDLLLCRFISNNNTGRNAGTVPGRSALLKRVTECSEILSSLPNSSTQLIQ